MKTWQLGSRQAQLRRMIFLQVLGQSFWLSTLSLSTNYFEYADCSFKWQGGIYVRKRDVKWIDIPQLLSLLSLFNSYCLHPQQNYISHNKWSIRPCHGLLISSLLYCVPPTQTNLKPHSSLSPVMLRSSRVLQETLMSFTRRRREKLKSFCFRALMKLIIRSGCLFWNLNWYSSFKLNSQKHCPVLVYVS